MLNEEQIAFRRGLRRIDEGGVNRIMYHGKHGFIIISANRSEIYSSNPRCDLTDEYIKWCKSEDKNPEDKNNMDFWLNKRNGIADSKLLEELKKSKYAYTPVYGGYHGKDNVADSFEPSYIVYCHAKEDSNAYLNFDDLFEFALHLTREYKQESVYVQAPNKAPIYVDADGNKANKIESNNFKINDYTQEFFTTINRKKRTSNDYKKTNGTTAFTTPPQRFTADIQFESFYRKAAPSTYFDRMKRRKLGEVFTDK